jgi:predicted ferric reductase
MCSSRGMNDAGEVAAMLWTIFVILLVLWLLGLVSSYTLGGFIHILLVLAVVVLLFQLISGRRPVV